MTPFEKAGYTEDTKFRGLIDYWPLKRGDIVTLYDDDGTICPWFITDDGSTLVLWLPGTAPSGCVEELEVYELPKTKAVLMNGPIKVGKDVAINHVIGKYHNSVIKETKEHVHKMTQLMFNVTEDRYFELYNNRETKELPVEEFSIMLDRRDKTKLLDILGVERLDDRISWLRKRTIEGTDCIELSSREAMIYVSEVICKPRFGRDYFGQVRADKVCEGDLVFDASTAAFEVGCEILCEELQPLIDKLGQDNILLIRIHREGYTFEGDSRRYVPDGVAVNTIDVYNNSDEEIFL